MSIKNCTLASSALTSESSIIFFCLASSFLALCAVIFILTFSFFKFSFALSSLSLTSPLFCFHSQFAKHTNTSTDTRILFFVLLLRFLFAAIKKSSNTNVKEEMRKKIISFNIQSKYTLLFEIWAWVWVGVLFAFTHFTLHSI